MSKIICFDIYPSYRDDINYMRKILIKNGFEEQENKYGSFFHAEAGRWQAFHISNIIACHKYKYKKYDKCWNRSSNYRSEFFKHYHGPYRCAYCGKKLTRSTLEVDHFIPVAKAKSSVKARMLLWINAIYNVNNYRNLVPACHKCNAAKSDNMGRWIIIGSFGRYYYFWPILYCLLAVFSVALLYWVTYILGFSDVIIQALRNFIGDTMSAV